MSSTFSPSLRIELIPDGDQAGTWGTTTNTNLGTLIEAAIAGVATVNVTATNQALVYADGVADQARSAVLRLTTALGAAFSVYVPPFPKQYTVFNDSARDATIFNSTTSGNTTAAGTGVMVPAGRISSVWSNGADFALQNTNYQAVLVSGTNIRTVNGSSLLGASNLVVGDVTAAGAQTLTNKTLTGYTETVFALTGTTPALNPANGTVQTWTLSGNSTPTSAIAAGQSMTLMIDDGAAFTITWPSVNWRTNAGTAPTLNTTGFTAIVLWNVGTVLYGARVGDA